MNDTGAPQQQSLETVIYRLGALEMNIGNLAEKLDQISTFLMQQERCTTPNACAVLTTKQDEILRSIDGLRGEAKELEARVSVLERTDEYRKGVGKGLMLAIGALGGLAGAIVSFVAQKLFGT